MDATQTYQDIEQTLGHVPEFIREIPQQAVGPFWDTMKNFQMTDSAIPVKYKDLIGVAVAAAIPCDYCTFFHKSVARMNGASDEEIRETIMMASTTRQGSTIVNGLGQDLERFKDEVREIGRHVQSQQQGQQGQRQTARR